MHTEKKGIVRIYIVVSAIKCSSPRECLYFVVETIHTHDRSKYNYSVRN